MNITLENDTILPKQIRLYRDGVYIAGIWYGGDDNDCKTEAEAREAAELLKAFFEAKSKGISCRLVCGETIPGIVGGVIDTQPPKKTTINYERLYPENFNAELQNEKHERHARQQIAHMATEIFVSDNEFTESNAVKKAAYMWRLSQTIDL